MKSFRLGCALMFGVCLSGCLDSHAAPDHRSEVAAESADQARAMAFSPVKVAVLVDQTVSMTWSQTSPVTAESLGPLIEYLRRVSGELGITLIRDKSGYGLVRLRIEPAPEIGEAPKRTGRPFKDARAQSRRRREATEEQMRQSAWEEETNQRIEKFLAQVQPLLDRKNNARCTDLWTAVTRADSFLSEEERGWPANYSRFGLIQSDGVPLPYFSSTPG